jgi:hypothetical protein
VAGVNRGGAARVCVLLFAFALCLCTSALGAEVNNFGAQGTGAGEFFEPRGIAVDQKNAHVYVGDANNSRMEQFVESGEFTLGWGWGVLSGAAIAQTCSAQCVAGVEGAGAGQFGAPTGVAVDNDPLSASFGDVYVVDSRNERIEKFDSSGHFILMVGGGVNLETHANVCLAGEACGVGAEGVGPGEFTSLRGSVVAVTAAGDLLVGNQEHIQRFTEGGAPVGTVAIPGAGEVRGLAVDSEDHVYVVATEFAAVHKYDLTGKELGEPRATPESPLAITLAPAGELFVSTESGSAHHIVEFDTAGTELSSFDAGPPNGENARGIAFVENLGAVDVLNGSEVRVVQPPPAGPVILDGSLNATGVGRTGATLNATANPEGQPAVSYSFEYGETVAYGNTTAATPLGTGFEDAPAVGSIAGLSPNTTYHYRLVVSDGAAHVRTSADATFKTLPPAGVDAEGVSHVADTSAILDGSVNPLSSETTYQFEYGTTTAYGSTAPSVPAGAGSGEVDVPVEESIQGLTAGTTYHYRLSVENGLGRFSGEDRVFTTQTAAGGGLDGRIDEMVSPAAKNGVSFEALTREGGIIQAAAEGNAFAYIAKAPINHEPLGNRSISDTQLLAQRIGPAVWKTTDISTPHEGPAGTIPGMLSEYHQFSDDLRQAAVEPAGATPLAPSIMGEHGERTPYIREETGAFIPLVTKGNVPEGVHFGGIEIRPEAFIQGVTYIAGTPDFSELIVSARAPLTKGFEPGESNNLFSWRKGSLELVSVLPNGAPVSSEGLNAALGQENFAMENALSRDGTRIVFEALASSPRLYVRDLKLQQTVRVDVPEAGLPTRSGQVVFQAANTDGSKIFFSDDAQLTRDSHAKETEPDLYMCEVVVVGPALTCHITDLSKVLFARERANVQKRILGVSDSGRYVYYVANGRLAAGAEHGNCAAGTSEGENELCTLYMTDTETGQTRMLARLAGADGPDWGSTGSQDLGEVTSRVSPNGQYVAFMSLRSLTGFDNRDAHSGARDQEVFVYSLEDSTLTCASCNPMGARPNGVFDTSRFPGLLVDRPNNWSSQWLAGSIPGWTRVDLAFSQYQSRYLSDKGRLFFTSPDQLVPHDTNGKEDVYEYEPSGIGNCADQRGCVGLVSSGTSGEESAFLDASSEGENVFFMTSARLTPSDSDNAYDIYDARVCGEAAACTAPEVLGAKSCSGVDACRTGPAFAPEVLPQPPSSGSSGGGNLAPVTSAHAPTRAELLRRALKRCATRPRRSRKRCVAQARKHYGRRPLSSTSHGKRRK